MKTGASVTMPRHLRERRPVLARVIHAATAAAILGAWGLALARMIR